MKNMNLPVVGVGIHIFQASASGPLLLSRHKKAGRFFKKEA
ncbi:MAG: hypothetical protein ACLVKK_07310 [Ruthenibacterium sp.]